MASAAKPSMQQLQQLQQQQQRMHVRPGFEGRQAPAAKQQQPLDAFLCGSFGDTGGRVDDGLELHAAEKALGLSSSSELGASLIDVSAGGAAGAKSGENLQLMADEFLCEKTGAAAQAPNPAAGETPHLPPNLLQQETPAAAPTEEQPQHAEHAVPEVMAACSSSSSSSSSAAREAVDGSLCAMPLVAKELQDARKQLQAFAAAAEVGLRRCGQHVQSLRTDLADLYVRLAEMAQEIDAIEDNKDAARATAAAVAAVAVRKQERHPDRDAKSEGDGWAVGPSVVRLSASPPPLGLGMLRVLQHEEEQQQQQQQQEQQQQEQQQLLGGPVLFGGGLEASEHDVSADQYLETTDVLRHYLLVTDAERRQREAMQQQIKETVLRQRRLAAANLQEQRQQQQQQQEQQRQLEQEQEQQEQQQNTTEGSAESEDAAVGEVPSEAASPTAAAAEAAEAEAAAGAAVSEKANVPCEGLGAGEAEEEGLSIACGEAFKEDLYGGPIHPWADCRSILAAAAEAAAAAGWLGEEEDGGEAAAAAAAADEEAANEAANESPATLHTSCCWGGPCALLPHKLRGPDDPSRPRPPLLQQVLQQLQQSAAAAAAKRRHARIPDCYAPSDYASDASAESELQQQQQQQQRQRMAGRPAQQHGGLSPAHCQQELQQQQGQQLQQQQTQQQQQLLLQEGVENGRTSGVVFDMQRNCWEARWMEAGELQSKSFSVVKYGEDLAYKLSVQCRMAHAPEGAPGPLEAEGIGSREETAAAQITEAPPHPRRRVRAGMGGKRASAPGVAAAAANGTSSSSSSKQEHHTGSSRSNGRGCGYRNGILGVSFSRTGNAWLAYIKNRTTKTQINKYFRVSIYGWRGAKRKAIETRLELEEEMRRQHPGHWDVSPCMPPAVYYDAVSKAWVAASQDPVTGQLITKAFSVADTPGGAAAARSAAIEARLEMDDDEEEKDIRVGRREPEGEEELGPSPPEAVPELAAAHAEEEDSICTDAGAGIPKEDAQGNKLQELTQQHQQHQHQHQQEAVGDVPTSPTEVVAHVDSQGLGDVEQQQPFLSEASSAASYAAAAMAEEGRLKARKRRRTPAAGMGALGASGPPGSLKTRRPPRPDAGGYGGDEREAKQDNPASCALQSSDFSAGIDGAAAVAELMGETTKTGDASRSAASHDAAAAFHCPPSTAGLAAPGAVADVERVGGTEALAAHVGGGGICVNNQAAAVQVQQLSALLAPEQLEQQQQQKPYCCTQHLEMLQQMDEIQRQLPEVALCRQSMYRRLVAITEQPATPEQIRELEAARADFEELSQQQLRMEQQLQLLNQQQHHHALQHRAELLQQQGVTQHNTSPQSQELLQQQGLLQEQELLQQRVLQQRLLQQRVLQQQLMQQQQFIQQQQLLQQQQLQPQQLLQQQRLPAGEAFPQLDPLAVTGSNTQVAVAAHNTEHEQQQQQTYFGQPTF